jgi:hypothetical protein
MLAANPGTPPNGHFYYKTYLDVAKRFNASFWSYVDVSYSEYGSAFKTTSEHLYRFVRGQGAGLNKHITWFAHLFTADLYANILTYIMSKCELDPKTADPNSMDARYTRKPDASWSLPALEHPSIGCGRDSNYEGHMKLEASAGNEMMNPTILTKIVPVDSWRLFEDRPGKPGWIIESAMDATRLGILTFPISFKNVTDSQFVRIEYLRTYEHAGTAEIRLCGKHLATLDALWQNPESYKKSLSYFRTIRFDVTLFCENKKLSADDLVSLEIISPSFLPPDDPHPHRSQKIRSLANEQIEPHLRGEVNRGTAKFKLISISMCD